MKTLQINSVSHPRGLNTRTASRQTAPCSYAKFDDGEVVDGLRAGSAQALQQIMESYRSRIHGLAFRFTGNHQDAEEIVQETFLRAFRAAPNFRGDSSLSTWLHSIAMNLSRNRYWYWRRRKRHESVSLDAPAHPALQATLHSVLAVEDHGASAESEQNDLAEQIERGMAQLSEPDRRILLLRNAQHTPYAEIARVLGIAMGTVKSRIARARERLRATMNAETGNDFVTLRKAS